MQTTLPPELEAFVKKQAETFAPLKGPDDFLDIAEALVKDEATKKAVRLAWYKHLVEEADRRGGAIPAEQVFTEIKVMLADMDQQRLSK